MGDPAPTFISTNGHCSGPNIRVRLHAGYSASRMRHTFREPSLLALFVAAVAGSHRGGDGAYRFDSAECVGGVLGPGGRGMEWLREVPFGDPTAVAVPNRVGCLNQAHL